MKYLVTKTEDGTEEIFVFPLSVHHDIMADAVCSLRNQSRGDWKRIKREVISAGFVTQGRCVGYSETLKLKSREVDTALLTSSNSLTLCPNQSNQT